MTSSRSSVAGRRWMVLATRCRQATGCRLQMTLQGIQQVKVQQQQQPQQQLVKWHRQMTAPWHLAEVSHLLMCSLCTQHLRTLQRAAACSSSRYTPHMLRAAHFSLTPLLSLQQHSPASQLQKQGCQAWHICHRASCDAAAAGRQQRHRKQEAAAALPRPCLIHPGCLDHQRNLQVVSVAAAEWLRRGKCRCQTSRPLPQQGRSCVEQVPLLRTRHPPPSSAGAACSGDLSGGH